ncbi:hypothetical protein ACWEWQ_41300, partial [Streptomyces sp. NPDC003832]
RGRGPSPPGPPARSPGTRWGSFLYRHKDLFAQVHAAGAEPPGDGTGHPVIRASLQADLANALERSNRLAARGRQLEAKLSELLGEHVWRESGLGGAR